MHVFHNFHLYSRISLSEIESNLDLILKNDSNPEHIKRGKESFENFCLAFVLKETKQELNSIIDRKISQKLYNVNRSRQLKAEIEKLDVLDLSIYKRKRVEGIAKLLTVFEKKQTQKKILAFFIICPRNTRENEFVKENWDRFLAVKEAFLKFHRSKRHKIKALLHRLNASSETIISQSRSLLFSWRSLLHKRKLQLFSNSLNMGLILSRVSSENIRILKKAAFSQLLALKNRKKRLIFALEALFLKKKRQFFMRFRLIEARNAALNSSSRVMRLYFSLETMLRHRIVETFKGVKRKSPRNFELGFKTIAILCEKLRQKQKWSVFRQISAFSQHKSIKKTLQAAKISKLFEIMSLFYRKVRQVIFLKLRFTNLKPLIRKVLRIYQSKRRDFLRTAFFKWRGNVIVKKIERKNLTNKVKGKILLSFSRNESDLTLKSAFLRWKVRADRSFLKSTMDRFALTSKISLLTVYFRFRSLLQPAVKPKKITKKPEIFPKKTLLGVIRLSFLLFAKQKSLKNYSLQKIKLFSVWARESQKRNVNSSILRQKLLRNLMKSKREDLLSLAFKKWVLCSKAKTAKQRFFSIVQKSTYTKVFQIFNLWRNADFQKSVRRGGISQVLNGFIHKNHKAIMDKLLAMNQTAKNKKLLAIKLIFDSTVNQSEKAFNKWANYTISMKLQQKTLKKANLLKSLQEILAGSIKMNLETCFFRLRDKKKGCNLITEKLIQFRNTRLRNSLFKIRSFVNNKSYLSKISNFQRGQAIKLLKTSISDHQKRELQQILRVFLSNSKGKRILNGFYRLLEKTPLEKGITGMFFEKTFSSSPRFQEIKHRFHPIMRLISSLQRMSNLRKKTVNGALGLERSRGEGKKRGAAKKILDSFNENLRKTLELKLFQWRKLVLMEKETDAHRRCFGFFDSLNSIVFHSLQTFFLEVKLDNALQKRKVAVIRRMFMVLRAKVSHSWSKWVDFTHMLLSKVRVAEVFKEKAILNVEKTLSDKNDGEKLKILALFKGHHRRVRSLKDVLEKIELKKERMLQKSLGALRSSRNFETLKFSKADSLKLKLQFLARRMLAETFNEINCSNIHCESRKLSALEKLIRNTEEQIRKKLLFWRSLNKLEKTQEVHRSTLALFSSSNEIFAENLAILLEKLDPSINTKKQAVIQRLFRNFQQKTKDSLNCWRNKEIFARVHREKAKKAYKLSQMNEFSIKFESRALARVMSWFAQNSRKKQMLVKLQSRLLRAFSAEIKESFLAWRNIPAKRVSEYEKPSNLMKTLRIFKKISYYDLRKTIQSFARVQSEGRSIKERAAKNVFVQFSEKKRDFFMNWKENSSKFKVLNQATSVIGVFESLSLVFFDNLRLLKDSALIADRRKEEVLKKLMSNFKRDLRENFLIWLGNAQIAMVEQQGQMSVVINALESHLRHHEKKDIKWTLRKFQQNRESNVQISKLYDTIIRFRLLKILTFFRSWRHIEKNPKLRSKAEKFSMGVEKFIRTFLKEETFAPLTLACQEGASVKLRAAQKFVDKMKDSRLASFFQWKQFSKNARNNLLLKFLLFSFEDANSVIIDHFSLIFRGLSKEKSAITFMKKLLIQKGKRIERLFFAKWKESVILEGKAKFAIKRFEKAVREFEHLEKKSVLGIFGRNMKRMKKLASFLGMLQRKMRNSMRVALERMVPEKSEKAKKAASSSLMEFMLRKTLIDRKAIFRRFWGWLKSGRFIKEKSALTVFLKEENKIQFSFRKWRIESFKEKTTERHKNVRNFFEILLQEMKKNNECLFLTRNQQNSRDFILKIERIAKKRMARTLENLQKNCQKSEISAKAELIRSLAMRKRDMLKECFYRWRSARNSRDSKSKLEFLKRALQRPADRLKKSAYLKLLLLKSSKSNNKALPLINLLSSRDSSLKRSVFATITRKIHSRNVRLRTLNSGLLNFRHLGKSLLSTCFEKIRHHAEIHIVKTYMNSLWKWKISNMESRYYTHFLKKARKTAAFTQIFKAIDAAQKKLKRCPLRNLENENKKLKKVFSLMISRVFSRKLFAFDQWRINALCLKNSALSQEKSLTKLENRLLSLFKTKKSLYFKKWLLEKNKAKFSQKVLLKSMRGLKKNAFLRWKLSVFSSRDRYKAMQLYLSLENHQKKSKKLAFSAIKQHFRRLSIGNSLISSLFTLANKSLKKRIFERIKKVGQVATRLQVERMKKLIPMMLSHRKRLLAMAFSNWKCGNLRKKLSLLFTILSQKRKIQLKSTLDAIFDFSQAKKTQSRLKGVVKLLIFGSNIEKFRLSNAFSLWRNSDPNRKNPWFARAISILAKDSMLNPQIAFWRMRDFRRVTRLNAPQIVKVKKMVNNLTKAFETVMSMAFWRVESYNGKGSYRGDSFGQKNSDFLRKIRGRILLEVLEKYDPRGLLEEAFERLKGVFPLFSRMNSGELKEMFSHSQVRNLQMIGLAFQMVFTINKLLSNNRIKNLTYGLKKLNNAVKNGFYSPVMKTITENEEAGDEIEHLKGMLEVGAKELEKKEEELCAAQECIEIIHDKLKQILVRRFVEINARQMKFLKQEAWEILINNIQ